MDNLDLILRFLLDQNSANQTSAGVGAVASELEQVDRVAKELDKTFERLEADIKTATSGKEFDHIERQLKDVEEQVNETTQAYRLQARVLRSEAAAITDDFVKARNAQIRSIGDQIGSFSQVALGAGVGLVGGIFAGAAAYVKNAKEATTVTRAWKAEQQSLERSGTRFGAVLAQESLPLLRQAAQLADKASRFVEQNPDVIRAALNTGVALATLGAVGVAVSKGIKIYTDFQSIALGAQQVAAAKLQHVAADKQLIAAKLRAGMAGALPDAKTASAAGGLGAGATGIGAGIGGAAGIAALVLANVAVSTKLSGQLDQLKNLFDQLKPGSGGIVRSIASSLIQAGPGGQIFAAVDSIKSIRSMLTSFLGKYSAANSKTSGGTVGARSTAATTGVAASPAFEQILKAYEDYKADDLALVQNHYAQRASIIQDSLQAELAVNRQYANAVSKVRANTGKSLASAASDFERANVQAEQNYQIQRAQIIRDGNQEIADIQKDSQERLRKLAEEHGDRVADLTSSRDALGLAKENRDYRRAANEEKRETAREIKERRQAIAQRLADLAQSYEQERAQRAADYQLRVAEIRAQAAEQLAELAAEHAEQLKQIREQKIAKLKEADAQFNEERKRRYQYFIQQVKDLDAALINERNLRFKYQQSMITDLDAFLASYRAKLGTLGTGTTAVAGKSAGGYASGVVRTGEMGIEYVLTNQTVKAAEAIIGGRLTQEGLLSALTGGNSVTWNDHRRFDGDYTSAMRRENRKDTMRLLNRAFS